MLNPQNEPLFSSYDSDTIGGRLSRWWKHNVTEYFSPPETPIVVKTTHSQDTSETPLVVKVTHPHDTSSQGTMILANSQDTSETPLVVKVTHPHAPSSQTAAARPMIWDPRKLFTDFIKRFAEPETPLYFDVLRNPDFIKYPAWRAQVDLKHECAERVFCQDLIWQVIQLSGKQIKNKHIKNFLKKYIGSIDQDFYEGIEKIISKFLDDADAYYQNHEDQETGTLFVTLPNTMVRSVIAKINASFDKYERELSVEEIDENVVEEPTFYQMAKESLQASYHVFLKHPWKKIGAIASTVAIIYAGKRAESTNFNPLTMPQFPQWVMPSWQMTNAATVFALSMTSVGREFAVPGAFAAMMFSMAQTVGADLTTGLVAHYPFDGDANDVSGNGNHAALFNGTTFAPGKFNQAISFDGIGNFARGDCSNFPTAERTIAFWFYTNSSTHHHGIFGYGSSLFIAMNNGDGVAPNALQVQSHGNINLLAYFYNTSAPINRWVHAAVRVSINGTCWFVDGQNKICNSIYINNTNVVGKQFGFGSIAHPNGSVPYSDPNVSYFQGMLDEFYIYFRALNDAEIRELYTGLVAYYPFDGDANDVSGNGNNATLFNGTTFAPGKFNQAISFDGIGNFARGDCSNFPTAERTIAFWVLRNFSIPAGNAFGYGGDPSCLKSFFIVLGDNQLIVPRHCDSSPFISNYNISGLTNRWFHIAVRTGTEDTCFFLNGQLNSCNNTVFTNTGVLGKQFGFGAIPDGLGYVPFPDPRAYFQGMLDEFYIYSRALNDTEIQDLYNLGVTTSSTSITTSSSSSSSSISVITTSSSFFGSSNTISTSQDHLSSKNASGSGFRILMLVLPIGGGSLLAMILAGLVYSRKHYRKNKDKQDQVEMKETPSTFPKNPEVDSQVTKRRGDKTSSQSQYGLPPTRPDSEVFGTEYTNRPSQPNSDVVGSEYANRPEGSGNDLPPDYANAPKRSSIVNPETQDSQYGKFFHDGQSDDLRLPESEYVKHLPKDNDELSLSSSSSGVFSPSGSSTT